MKKARILNVFSLIFNLAIIGLVIYALFVVVGNSLLQQFPRLDILGGGLLAIFALICIPFNIAGIAKGKKLSKFAYVLKLMGTTTALVVLGFCGIYLAKDNSWNIPAQFGDFSFTNSAFFLVLLVPALSLISFLFFDHSEKAKFPVNFLSMLPTLGYFAFYIINIFIKLLDVDYNHDWYNLFGAENNLVGAIVVAGVAVVAALLISIFLWLINRALNKAYYKENAAVSESNEENNEEQPQEEQPAEEPVKEEPAPQEEPAPAEELVEEEPQEEEEVDPVEVQDEYVDEEEEVEEVKEEPAPKVEKKPVEKKPAPAKKPAEKKPAEKKPAEKKPVEKKPAPAPKKEVKEAAPAKADGGTKVYHLTKRKEDGMWAITFVGGQKAVKLFKTKKEAEAALEVLTKNQGATALIRNSKGAKAGKFASSIKSDKED